MLEFATYLMSRDCKFSINDRRNLEAASFKVKLKFDVWGWNLLDGIVWSMEEVRFGGFDIVGDITTPSMFMIMRTKRHFFFPHKTIPRDDSLLLFHQLLQENSHFNPPLPPLLRPTFNRTQTGRRKFDWKNRRKPRSYTEGVGARRLMDHPLVVKSWLQSNGREKGGRGRPSGRRAKVNRPRGDIWREEAKGNKRGVERWWIA